MRSSEPVASTATRGLRAQTTLRNAGRGKRADLRSAETRPGLEHDVAFARVATARSHVVTLANGIGHLDAVVC